MRIIVVLLELTCILWMRFTKWLVGHMLRSLESKIDRDRASDRITTEKYSDLKERLGYAQRSLDKE